MATAVLKADRADKAPKPARREPLGRYLIIVALIAGLVVGTASYLASSLMIPGPTERAGTEELRARGAEVWIVFCSESAYEPRFWPECTQSTPEWRERGAERLIQYCTEGVASRMFRRDDCLAADRPMVGLSGGPQPKDLASGLIGGLAVAAILGAREWYRGRRQDGAGH